MKKIRVTVSDFMFEILKGDAEYFKIPLGKIGNTLFKYFIDKNLNKIELEESSGKKVQFNLSKENEDIFFDVLREKKANTEADDNYDKEIDKLLKDFSRKMEEIDLKLAKETNKLIMKIKMDLLDLENKREYTEKEKEKKNWLQNILGELEEIMEI